MAILSQQAFDSYVDSLTPREFEAEFGPDEYAEQVDAFGPGGWTDDLIEEYEDFLERTGVPSAYDLSF